MRLLGTTALQPASIVPTPALVSDGLRDVFVDLDDDEAFRAALPYLDSCGLRAIAGWAPASELSVATLDVLLDTCVAVLARDDSRTAALARRRSMPLLTIGESLPPLAMRAAAPRYAFMAVRIHDDFALVRDGLRTAIERELGFPCVYFEDRRICAQDPGVRARTLSLVRGAAFFVAELSRSPSCPDYDSPNTAHEIGFAQACGVPLLVCARAPRRNLYFSAGDLDTLFWRDESDLHAQVRAWLAPHRVNWGRRVLSWEWAQSRFAAPTFDASAHPAYAGPPGALARVAERLPSWLRWRRPPVAR